MVKKMICFISMIPQLASAIYEVDMTMDRPYTADIAIQPSQLYYKAINRTRPCSRCRPRINRWARCNKNNLQIDPELLDTTDIDDDCY